MGKVVKLEASSESRPRTRRRRSKTALVLGGGGFTGGVYEIGALRAFDLLAVNRTVNEFDLYVGTSAGSFVASLLANGVTPEEMMRTLNTKLPSPFKDPELGTMLRPNYRGFVQKAAVFPLKLVGLAQHLGRRLGEFSLIDVGAGLQSYVEEVLSDPDRSNDFRLLERELYLTATDLDTCERVILGEGEWADVPISKAVECSTALPIVYEPVDLKGRQLVDGGIRSTTNVDVAVERGAKFIVVVNPLVPFVNDFQKQIPTIFGTRVRRVSDMGLPAIGNQAFKLMAHARLHQAMASWREKYPGVDIILIEPEPNDELMFGTSILDYSARLQIAKHGFESVTVSLAKDYTRYKEIAERHGIKISARRVRTVIEKAEAQEPGPTSAWRRVLEQTTSALLRQSDEAS